MTLPAGPTPDADAPDEGFTLVDVVVALALLGLVASGTLGFFISGTRASADLQRRQVAVALASAAVEDARGFSTTLQKTTANGTTTTWPLLVRGRTKDAVDAQWAAGGSAPSATTFPAHDPTDPAGALLVPLSRPDRVGGVDYTTQVHIGTCYRLRAADARTAPCDRGPGTRGTTPPAGYQELVRISATTSWGAAAQCSGGACSYTASVLVDTAVDPQWNTSGGLAVDDSATARAGTDQVLDVLRNDTLIPADTSPVTVRSTPRGMSATADTSGRITLRVPAGSRAGQVSLTYSVKDVYGATSNTATVRVRVQG